MQTYYDVYEPILEISDANAKRQNIYKNIILIISILLILFILITVITILTKI